MATLDRDFTNENPADVDPAVSDPADAFCRLACLVYSEKDGPDRWAAARSILAERPDLPRRSLAAAAAAADPAAVDRHLAEKRDAAGLETGPHRWAPLLYLAYSRAQSPSEPADRYLACARLLLEAGADPNAGFLWRGLTPPFTVVTGVFGEGEQGPGKQPRHPHALELARLLLEAGADPTDQQTLYNRMFRPDDSHLVLLFDYGLGRSGTGIWQQRLGSSLEPAERMWARQLSWAIDHGFDDRVRLLIGHGVNATLPFPDGGTAAQRAIRSGRLSLLADLRRAGATIPELDDLDRLTGRLLDPDRAGSADPAPGADLLAALRRNRPALIHGATTPSAVAAVAAAGFDIDARADGSTALHQAAFAGDMAVLAALLEAGANREVTDDVHHHTPAQWAAYGRQDAAHAVLRGS
ncbi:ankyrin repeat domain-containing protein [Nakamurella sp. GG22]